MADKKSRQMLRKVKELNSESILDEISKIADKGIKEVVITGIHIASYGRDFKEEYTLIDLLEAINRIERINRKNAIICLCRQVN